MAAEAQTTRYVVGLGNPGRRYRKTRHNIGFMVLKEIRRRWDFGRPRSKFHSRMWTGNLAGRRVVLLAPQTYMNESGRAVAEALAFAKAPCDQALVVLDDMDLPLGRLRARATGSAGGHKGLGDVLAALGDGAEPPRLRIGIGRPAEGDDAVRYVLTEFSAEERPMIEDAIARAADVVADWVEKDIAYVMDRYNALETKA